MNYFLVAREGFGVAEDRFVDILRSQWPSVDIERIESSRDYHCLEFQFEMDGAPMRGALRRLEEINLPFPVDIYAYVWFLAERLDAFGTKV